MGPKEVSELDSNIYSMSQCFIASSLRRVQFRCRDARRRRYPKATQELMDRCSPTVFMYQRGW